MPAHCTLTDGLVDVAGNGAAELEGNELSMLLIHSGVSIGALVSNTMRAALRTLVPLGRPGFGITVNSTRPLPSG